MSDNDGLMKLPTVAEVDAEILRRQTSTGSGQGLALLVISLALFVGAEQTFGGTTLTFIGLLALVLLLHELGHLAAMRAFGFRDLRMFFIPFLGAAAAGKKPDATGTQRAIVALAGPISGIVLAFGFILAAALGYLNLDATMSEFVGLLLVINFFNLLPLIPFDGGRFINIVLFSRWPTAEKLFRIAAGAGMVWLAWQLESWILGIVGGFVVLGASFAAGLGRLGRVLRSRVPAPRPVSLLDTPPEFRAQLIEEMAPTIGLRMDNHAANVRRYAVVLTAAWDRAIDAPPGPLASAGLLLVYLGVIGSGVALYLRAAVGS